MHNDPIIAELRATRETHAAKFNFDIDKISADLRARQEQSKRSGRTFVTLPPRPAQLWEKLLVRFPVGESAT